MRTGWIGCLGLLILSLPGPLRSSPDDDPSLAVDRIPAALRIGAKAVVRRHELSFRASDDGSGTLTVRRAVTVLDPSARGYGQIAVWYDSFESVEDFEVTILDANGEEVSEISGSDIEDHAAYSETSLAIGIRVKLAEVSHARLPYTIVSSYELEREASFMWPDWLAHQSRDPVEWARFEVSVPASSPLRWWCNQDSVRPVVKRSGGDSVYVWSASMLPGLSSENGWDSWEDATIHVRIAPTEFEMGGRAGALDSWESFGAWFAPWYQQRRDLSLAAKEEARSVVSGVADTLERVRRLYRYMQRRTRYVSIQLGLGGWVPFPASTVHDRGYGDCKALTNYMIALLEAVEIPAYPVIIRSGYVARPFVHAFPSNQFNHVVVCVPMASDTVWLECTSQTMPPGRLGGSNEARSALMITPDGGRVVATPSSRAEENRMVRLAHLSIEPSGAVAAEVRLAYEGNQHDRFRTRWLDRSPSDRAQWLLNECGMRGANLRAIAVDSVEGEAASASARFTVAIPSYASKSGDRLFIPSNPFERFGTPPPAQSQRLSPVHLAYRYLDQDTVEWSLPETYRVESAPKGVVLEESFARYACRVEVTPNGTVRIIRTMMVSEPIIPPERYGAYRAFFQSVVKADRAPLVLVRDAAR